MGFVADSLSARKAVTTAHYGSTSRACYVCGRRDNPIVAVEPSEVRFGIPVMPEEIYRFARCHHCSTLYVDSDVTDAYLEGIYRNESREYAAELVGGDASTMITA